MQKGSFDNLNIPQNSQSVNSESDYSIKVYYELANAARKAKLQNEYLLSMQFRAINTTGSGFLDLKSAIEKLQQVFNYSEKTIYRILKKGNGEFYNINKRKGIELFSLKKLMNKFGLEHISRPKIIDIRGLSRGKIRSLIFATNFKNKDSNKEPHPVTRQTIKEVSGVKPQTQRRYEKKAKVEVKPNYSTEVVEYKSKNKVYKCNKRLGNSYTSQLKSGCKGATRKINKGFCKVNEQFLNKGRAFGYNLTVRFFDKPKTSKNLMCKDYIVYKKFPDFNMWEEVPKLVS